MALSLIRTLDDGATVLRDGADGSVFTLKPGQWSQIEFLPESEQRHRAQQFRDQNAEEWRRERGPDSGLGRNMEQGTPE